jgi:hypothetical protein
MQGYMSYITLKKYISSNMNIINIGKCWLIFILLFLPFHYNIVRSFALWNTELSIFIGRIDEITIVLFFIFAIKEFYKNRETFDRLYLILLFPIIIFSIIGLISGMANGNSLFVTCYGIFDYIKNFLVIFIYAAFFREFSSFKKIFSYLLIIAVFLGLIAFIQEVWALASVHILGRNINDIGIYILRYVLPMSGDWQLGYWRMGIYRAPSLMSHPNGVGLYCVLILTIFLCISRKINFAVFVSLLTGILLSISRQVYAGFLCLIGLQILRGRKWLLAILIIPIALLLYSASSLSEFDSSEFRIGNENLSYRVYTRMVAVDIWRDHPVWGVGPGMFGGPVSLKTKSPVYKKYNFGAMYMLKQWYSLDQFWPQVLAETGILGTGSFVGLFISLFATFFILRQRANSDEMKGLIEALIVYTIVILIYTVAMVLNVGAVLYTYSALSGITLGSIKTENHKQ